jgi:hypothetical protein
MIIGGIAGGADGGPFGPFQANAKGFAKLSGRTTDRIDSPSTQQEFSIGNAKVFSRQTGAHVDAFVAALAMPDPPK